MKTSSFARVHRPSSEADIPLAEPATLSAEANATLAPDPDVATIAPGRTWRPVAREAEIIAVLKASAAPHETIAMSFDLKERELRRLFDRLTASDSIELRKRIAFRLPGDEFAAWMHRMVSDRVLRLSTFLGDARRREAIRGVR